ncbi:hypothetical protein HYS54_03300 [Candidatus Micrarchaeota archaeon]|nr:hypothetical protein [Candidatus Micrarchaeota archaeon]
MGNIAREMTGAAIGAVAGGFIFAGVALASGRMLGYIALVAGILTGAGLRYIGNSKEPIKKALAIVVVFSLISIFIGYVVYYLFAEVTVKGLTIKVSEAISFGEYLQTVIGLIDVLFFAIGVYGGVRVMQGRISLPKPS